MSLKHVFSTVKKQSPILYWIVIVHFVFAIGSITGSFIDDRTLMGVNVWIKPLKLSPFVNLLNFKLLKSL